MSPKGVKVWFPAPAQFSPARCRECSRSIVWSKTPAGKWLPLDRARERRASDGSLELEPHWGYCPRSSRKADAGPPRRLCHARGCTDAITPGQVSKGRPFCRGCWGRIPRTVQEWIERTFDPGQVTGTAKPSRAFREACSAARKILQQVPAKPATLFGDEELAATDFD